MGAFNASGAPAALFSSLNYASAASVNAQTMELPRAPQGAMAFKDSKDISRELPVTEDAFMPLPVVAEEDIVRSASDQINVYVVKPGDTISQIAKMFGVTENTIYLFNNMKRGTALTPGQRLAILPISGVRYIVKKGDTVSTIAKRYAVDAEGIIEYNQLEGSVLAIGDEIIIPDGEGVLHSNTPSKPAPAKPGLPSLAGFFMRPSVGARTQGIHGNNGVDIAAAYGTPVVASAAGTVIIARSAGWNGGYGQMVVISHANGTKTLYAHLSSVVVAEGQKVAQGEKIGGMGNTGKVVGSHGGVHVHFEVHGAKNPF